MTSGADGFNAPVVSAGPDRTVSLLNAATLAGTASVGPSTTREVTLTSTWSLISGPGSVTFAHPSQPATTATFSKDGTYVLRLSASDGQFTTADDVTFTVKKPQTLTATADAYVEDGSSSKKNFGKVKQLLVKNSPNAGFTRETYIKFDISAFKQTGATAAKLRLSGSLQDARGANVETDVYETSTGWTETGINWNNRAPAGTYRGTILVANTTPTYYELDVTAAVQAAIAAGKKQIAFLLRNPVTAVPFSAFGSRVSEQAATGGSAGDVSPIQLNPNPENDLLGVRLHRDGIVIGLASVPAYRHRAIL